LTGIASMICTMQFDHKSESHSWLNFSCVVLFQFLRKSCHFNSWTNYFKREWEQLSLVKCFRVTLPLILFGSLRDNQFYFPRPE